ncbi:hypothetical protein VWY14_22635, partial [Xanthomonas citri pv. citri]
YYTELAEAADPRLRTGEQLEWLAVLDAEQGNLDAALRHSDDPLRLVLPLFWPWHVRGRRREMREQAAAVLRRVGAVPPEGRELAHGLCRMLAGAEPPGVVLGSDHPAALLSWMFGNVVEAPPDVVDLAERHLARLHAHPDLWT